MCNERKNTILNETLEFFFDQITELIRQRDTFRDALITSNERLKFTEDELDRYKSLYMRKVRNGGKK